MQEYGGYLPFELRESKEYYNEKNMLRLNCGRTAIITAIKDGKYHKVYIPLYLCESVKNSLQKYEINFEFYHINRDFEPIGVNIQKNECILIVNYYGIIPYAKMKEYVLQYKNVIIDNTQAFFSDPIMEAYNVYSCRKFLGVADGAYLIKKDIRKVVYKKDKSYDRYEFMLQSIEEGTNAAYQGNLKNEKYIEKAELLLMSDLTHKILNSIDYEYIKKRRKENFMIWHKELKNINELDIQMESYVVPMVYPLVYTHMDLRQLLVKEKRVYVSQWWKWLLNVDKANNFEKKMSQYLFPLPLDQRYSINEIMDILTIIKEVING